MIVAIILFALFLWYVVTHHKKSKTLPPGPFKFPIIGNIPQVGAASDYPPEAIDKLSKIHGEIMSIQLGAINTVFLCKYEDIRELFNRPELIDRDMSIEVLKDRNMHKNLGFIWSNGPDWETMKRFTLRNLRDFGFGKSSSMEIAIQDEMQEFIKYLETKMDENNGIVKMYNLFTPVTVNVIWRFVTGNRFSYSDSKIGRLIRMSDEFFKATDIIGLPIAFPILRNMFPNWSGKTEQLRIISEFHKFFREEIAEYEKIETRKTDPQSYMEVFINKVESEKNTSNPTFTEDQLLTNLLDMFQGGSDTTSTTLEHAFLHLILNPKVQEKIQAEIDEIIGEGNLPSLSHRPSLIYTEATIHEILRIGMVLPQPTGRKVVQDFYHEGLLFKKGTTVMANFHSVMFNENIWKDPKNFRPDRFIKQDGSLDKKLCDTVNVFGHGKRACLGESIARADLFLVLTTLLQKMTFKIVPGQPAPTTKIKIGMTMNPYPYETYVSLRK